MVGVGMRTQNGIGVLTPDGLKVLRGVVAAKGSSYVDITRRQFEAWLKSTKLPWSLRDDTQGVYQLVLSDNVAIKVSSTLGRTNATKGYAKASMQMRMVSRVTGRVLNKKAQGRSHYKRTKNWRKNLSEGVSRFQDAYNDSRSFYDAIAEIEDRDAYKSDLIAKIEGAANWRRNPALVEYHERLSSGKILTLDQKSKLEQLVSQKPRTRQAPSKRDKPSVPPTPTPEPEQPSQGGLLNRLRKLWVAARARSNNPRDRKDALWTMNFARSLGEWVKSGKEITTPQLSKAEEKFERYGV
jgi:hypothetical protein